MFKLKTSEIDKMIEELVEMDIPVYKKMGIRRTMINDGIGQNTTLKFANVVDIEDTQKMLQRLFLELISRQAIELFYKSADKKGYTDMLELYKEIEEIHYAEPQRRFLNIVLTL